MFARYPGVPASLSAVSTAVLLLGAVSFPGGSAHAFGLNLDYEDAMQVATDHLNDLGEQDAGRRGKSADQRWLDRAAGKAADRIQKETWKLGKKGWDRLKKTKKFGPLAKKSRQAIRTHCRKGVALFESRREGMGSRVPGRGQADRPLRRAPADRPVFREEVGKATGRAQPGDRPPPKPRGATTPARGAAGRQEGCAGHAGRGGGDSDVAGGQAGPLGAGRQGGLERHRNRHDRMGSRDPRWREEALGLGIFGRPVRATAWRADNACTRQGARHGSARPRLTTPLIVVSQII